jgi:hypothetical protein
MDMIDEMPGKDVATNCGEIGYCPVLEEYNYSLYSDEVNDWNEGE